MSWLFPGMEGAPKRRRGDGHPVLLGVAGACLLMFVIFVVVSVIVVAAGKSLELCDVKDSESPSFGNVEWHWIPPYPECVRRTGDVERREAVVFDPVTGSVALLLFVVAAGMFGWWLVLTVREAEKITEEESSR